MFYGSFLFKFIGVFAIWLVKKTYSLFTKRDSDSFKKIWTGEQNDNPTNNISNDFSQILLGAIILSIILVSLVKSGV